MILIESVQSRHVDGHFCVVPHFDPVEAFGPDIMGDDGYVTTETVVADRFKDATGRTFDIGMTAEVRAVLGLPMEAFRNQVNEIHSLHQHRGRLLRENSALVRANHGHLAHIRNLRRHLNDFEQMPWWKRLGFLFKTGGRVW